MLPRLPLDTELIRVYRQPGALSEAQLYVFEASRYSDIHGLSYTRRKSSPTQ